MTTRLEHLTRCIVIAANDIKNKREDIDAWTISIRSDERCLTIELYSAAGQEWVSTHPTAGWDGTIKSIKERLTRSLMPDNGQEVKHERRRKRSG